LSKALFFSHPEIENLYPLRERSVPTPLQMLLGRPIGAFVLEGLQSVNPKDVVAAFPQASRIADFLKPTTRVVPVDCNENPATALSRIIDDLIEDFLILQVGSFIASQEIYSSLVTRWNETGASLALLVPHAPGEDVIGVHAIRFEIDLQSKTIEKVEIGGERGLYFTGLMIVDRDFVKLLKERKSILESVALYFSDRSRGFHVWTGSFSSVNSPFNLLEAAKEVLSEVRDTRVHAKAKISPTAVLEGPVIIDEHAVVDHYSVIKGPAYIGRGALVGAHSFVRQYVTIESNAVVGAGSEVKRSYVGPSSFISSHCYITDSVIGDQALIRPFVVTLNYDPQEATRPGMLVKKGSIIGERSIANGGSVLRPRSIVRPGEVYQP